MSPSTNTSATDRAVLCQRAGELADFVPLLAELGMRVEIHDGELPSPEALAGARLVVVAGQRLSEGRAAAIRHWPRTLAVVDDGSRTLAAHLNRLGVAMVVRRPIHPRTLRLLILHQLYCGPERRGKRRIPIGQPIRAGAGLFKSDATLLELSRNGARLALAAPPKVGSVIQLVLGKELTNGKPIKLQAKVVRSIRAAGAGNDSSQGEIGVTLLDASDYARPTPESAPNRSAAPATPAATVRPAAPAPAAVLRAMPIPKPFHPKDRTTPTGDQPTPQPVAAPELPVTAPTATTARIQLPPEPAKPRVLPPCFRQPTSSPTPPQAPMQAQMPAPVPVPVPIAPVTIQPARFEVDFEAPDSGDPYDTVDLDCDFEAELDEAFELDLVEPLTLESETHDSADVPETGTGERRRTERVVYDQRVVALDAQAARVVVGRDLCRGGMRIAANPALALGDVLRIALHAGTETEPLIVLAGVERDDGADGLALAFAELTPGQHTRLDQIIATSGNIHGHAEDEDTNDGEGESLFVGELLARVARGQTRQTAGFTLIELMIVVAIIGIMSSVAIPLFDRYQLRANSSEVQTNLGAIRVVQEAYFAEYSRYVAANAEPPLIPGPTPTDFDVVGTDYAEVGWSPEGRVYFSYAVAISADEAGFTSDAAADIDGNGILQIWGYAKPDPLGAMTAGGLGCDPTLLEPELIGSCTVGSPAF